MTHAMKSPQNDEIIERLKTVSPRLLAILIASANVYRIRIDELVLGERSTHTTHARHCAFWVARRLLPELSSSNIARQLDLVPSSVREGVLTHGKRMQDPHVRQLTDDLVERLKEDLEQPATHKWES